MAESHVVSGLIAKRSELDGIVQFHRAEIHRLSVDLGHVDAAIKLFEPEFDLRTVHTKVLRQSNPYFIHGEAPRMVLDVLRRSNGVAIGTRQIGEEMISANGVDLKGVEDWNLLLKPVFSALKRLEKKGTVKTVGFASHSGRGRGSMQWVLV